ncbi:hypothetical protein ABT009_28690 [Streptomyces sp. NPDC002896]|uniref:hypothetical protein n=1 Tax=Streptomyces sp. NPDC002896 TaxID=3154438 RepID=UPI0033288EEF
MSTSLGGQPGVQIFGHSLVGVAVEPAGLTLQESTERGLGGLVAVEAAPADGRPMIVGTGNVDGEGPGSVLAVGEQVRTASAELVALGVAAATPAIDTAAAEGGTHEDRLQEAEEVPTSPACDHTRPPSPSHPR